MTEFELSHVKHETGNKTPIDTEQPIRIQIYNLQLQSLQIRDQMAQGNNNNAKTNQ